MCSVPLFCLTLDTLGGGAVAPKGAEVGLGGVSLILSSLPPSTSWLAVMLISALMNDGVATSRQSDQAHPAHDSSLTETTTKFTKKEEKKELRG